MAISKERDFELRMTVVIGGFGKQAHWIKLARQFKKVIAVHLGEGIVNVTDVRLVMDGVPGEWYPCSDTPGLGLIEPFDYEGE